MSSNYALSALERCKQWLLFTRQFYLFDARWQDPFESGERIARIIQGKHKPYYDPENDVGDIVVAINSRHIAMPNDIWKLQKIHYHNKYARSHRMISAYEFHENNPTEILRNCVRKYVRCNRLQRFHMGRLLVYPDSTIPGHMLRNINFQLTGGRRVPKRIDEYTTEEIENFPMVCQMHEEYTIDFIENDPMLPTDPKYYTKDY